MFRPCIDLHEGKVKQIVGGTLGATDLRTNFIPRNRAGSPGYTNVINSPADM